MKKALQLTQDTKQKIWEKYSVYILLIVLFTMISVNNDKAAVNIYRLLFCLPLLLFIRKNDIIACCKNSFINKYLALTLFCSISLLWTDSDTIKNMAIKILTMTIFLHLTYIASIYNPKVFKKMDEAYILMALLLIGYIISKYMGQGIPGDSVHGIFRNKNEVAWFLSSACIVTIYKLAFEKANAYLFGIFFIFIAILWKIQSRAALIGFCAGFLMISACIIKQYGYKKISKFFILGALLFIPAIFLAGKINVIGHLIARADSYRFEIYAAAFHKITMNIGTIFFGHGIAANSEYTLSNGIVVSHWHSIYINTIFYVGIIGFSLFVYCFFDRFWMLLKKKTTLCVWDVVLLGTSVALLFDGDTLFNYPNGVYLSFILPAFFAHFYNNCKVND
ncbi:MAG: O-antigen ligase family protein [Endozoicomonas sp. (ex Botrylloides leachii)]|nr:O-antigen ligase family protein [Endozoicomonas sp. (ex Botrylloides leachii)]